MKESKFITHIKAIILHYNLCFLNEGKGSKNILQLLHANSSEPGLTHDDLLAFDSTQKIDIDSFVDVYEHFFYTYGFRLVVYENDDTGPLLSIQDVEKYKQFLKTLSTHKDEVIKRVFVQKIDKGLERTINFAYIVSRGSEEEQELDVSRLYDGLFKNIPYIIERHESIDPDPPGKIHMIRKRLLLKAEAYAGGYLKAYLLLEKFYSEEQVGDKSYDKLLLDLCDFQKYSYLTLWEITFEYLEIVRKVYGKIAQPVFDIVVTNLRIVMDQLNVKISNLEIPFLESKIEHIKHKIACYDDTLKTFEKTELEVIHHKKSVLSQNKQSFNQKCNYVLQLISLQGFTEKEKEILLKKIKNLKPKKKIHVSF